MKQLRQRAIRDLVEQRPIRTQQELAAALRERGFRATQATISRDVSRPRQGGAAAQAYAIRPPARGERAARTASDAAARHARRDARGRHDAHPGRCPGRRTRWPRHSIGLAGPRSWARSRATTPCSWPSPTGGRWPGSDAGSRRWASCRRSAARNRAHPQRPLDVRGVQLALAGDPRVGGAGRAGEREGIGRRQAAGEPGEEPGQERVAAANRPGSPVGRGQPPRDQAPSAVARLAPCTPRVTIAIDAPRSRSSAAAAAARFSVRAAP